MARRRLKAISITGPGIPTCINTFPSYTLEIYFRDHDNGDDELGYDPYLVLEVVMLLVTSDTEGCPCENLRRNKGPRTF